MNEFEGLRKAGRFAIDEVTEVEGELILRGPQSTLDLFSNNPFHTHGLPDGSITGTFLDRSKVSLLSCITTRGPGGGHDRSGQRFHTASVFPHLVIFGDEAIAASDQKIRSVHFIIEDAHAIFYDWDAFGDFDGDAAHLADLIRKHGRKDASFGPDIGHPQIYYYTGKYTIFKAQTLLGEVSASHNPTITHGVRGTQIKDRIRLNIEFPDTLTAGAAMNRYFVLLRFIELMAGRRQNLERLTFGIDVDGSAMRALQEVYVCHRPLYERFEDDRGPGPADLPMMAADEPQAFGEVLRRYIEREDEWLTARVRFAPSLEAGRVYTTDRLIGAANMFDVLPDSAFALPPSLPADIAAAKAEARKIFKALPFSAERDSVLGALRRLGTLTLRQKIYSRSALVIAQAPERFPELEWILGHSVACRNFYVHGTSAKVDYARHVDAAVHLTDALEFVFGASDLIDAGWDMKAWLKRGSTMSHPFAGFVFNYAERLAILKRAFDSGQAGSAAPP